MRNLNEKKIVEEISNGNMEYFQDLVETYKKKVFFLANNILGDSTEAEDVSQEVFIKVFRFIDKFRKGSKLSTWIYQITVNTSIDEIRKRNRNPQILMEDSKMEAIHNMTREAALNPEDEVVLQNQIKFMLERVSPRERAAVTLRYLKGFKVNEISKILNTSNGAIKSLLARARKKLHKEYLVAQRNM